MYDWQKACFNLKTVRCYTVRYPAGWRFHKSSVDHHERAAKLTNPRPETWGVVVPA